MPELLRGRSTTFTEGPSSSVHVDGLDNLTATRLVSFSCPVHRKVGLQNTGPTWGSHGPDPSIL